MISDIKGCIVFPTYNNAGTLKGVLDRIFAVVEKDTTIIVVNDGCTDSTAEILDAYSDRIVLLTNERNSGKGFSLRRGLRKALELGFEHALTIDSDGQHYPEDIPLLVAKAKEHPGAVIMGSRNMDQDGVPGKSSFGNRFSNFWFKLETWITLPDTQTGFRIYPLAPLKRMRFFTSKFEFEIEIIVRLAWKKVAFYPVAIRVKYDPDERVSHFRPGRDFFRISLLNSVLVLGALLYYYPLRFFSKNTLRLIRDETIKPQESNMRKAISLAFGCFMGIVPIWGFQLLIGIPLAVLFRLNKVLFIAAANISIPPMIPIVIYASLIMGQLVMNGEVDHAAIFSMTLDSVQENLTQYLIGASLLAVTAFVVVFLVSYALLKLLRKEPTATSTDS
ncbi:MAG: glycosyltransferase [Bacteroidetes bacterium RIFCSPHIGHO2_02_FULL_44_7]|nr:MAG: glycosyltransferase [Bacteroidetes bacterium RIFCSPHIGHO2_02_FULL_44_7]